MRSPHRIPPEFMDMCNGILRELGRLWDVPELAATTKVVVSARMRQNLGICRVARREVAIAAGLVAGQDRALLREVIVHVVADDKLPAILNRR